MRAGAREFAHACTAVAEARMRTRRALWQITAAHACRHMRIVMRACERALVYALCDCAIHTTREVEGAGEDAPHKHTNTQTRTVGRSAGLARRGCGCGCSAGMTIGDFCRWPPCGVHPTAAAAPITHSLTAAKRSCCGPRRGAWDWAHVERKVRMCGGIGSIGLPSGTATQKPSTSGST
jgi:hypothetical protein